MDTEDIFQMVRLKEPQALVYLNDKDIVNLTNFENQSLLQEAIAYKNQAAIDKLLDAELNIDHQDKVGRSALHSCVTHDDLTTLLGLIDKGININLRDTHGNEALWTAVLKPKVNYEIVSTLVANGSDVSHENIHGRSPMMMAKTKNNEKMIKLLELGI